MGWEEDLLRDQTGGMKARLERISLILSQCTVKMGGKERTKATGDDHQHEPRFFFEEYESMPLPSRTFVYVRLRQLSLGHEFRYSATCPVCRKHIPRIMFPLNTLAVVSADDDFCEKETHMVSSDGFDIEWRMPVARNEARMIELKEKNPSDLESAELFPFVVSINGRKPTSLRDLKVLSGEARTALRGAVNVGGIELVVTNECSGGHEFVTPLPIFNRSFFLPSAEK
jgi:hypothetical protein